MFYCMARGQSSNDAQVSSRSITFKPVQGIVLDQQTKQAITAALKKHKPLSIALAGSRAYGLEHKDSDVDIRGYYQANIRELLSLFGPADSVDIKDPDMTVYELGRFFKLISQSNPTTLEQVHAPEFYSTDISEMIRAQKENFISARVSDTYGGFAMSQYNHWKKGTNGSALSPKRQAKHLRHIFRILEQGTGILANGKLELRVKDPEFFHSIAGWTDQRIDAEFVEKDKRLKEALAKTSLPEKVDIDFVNDLASTIRIKSLGL